MLFQQLAVARFRETRSRPFGELDGRVGIGIIVYTKKLYDNSAVPLILRRTVRRLLSAKILRSHDVYCSHGEVREGPDRIELILEEEEWHEPGT